MAMLQIKADDQLLADARTVAESMGMNLAIAVRMFLTQMVRENGLPFKPYTDLVLCLKDQEMLAKALLNGEVQEANDRLKKAAERYKKEVVSR